MKDADLSPFRVLVCFHFFRSLQVFVWLSCHVHRKSGALQAFRVFRHFRVFRGYLIIGSVIAAWYKHSVYAVNQKKGVPHGTPCDTPSEKRK